jgi:hypothetical protein
MWTISKALWMFDVHMALERRAREQTPAVDDQTDSECSYGDLDLSIITESSDDSDVTLVESDSDSDFGSDDAHRVRSKREKESANVDDEAFEDVCLGYSQSPSPSPQPLKRQPKAVNKATRRADTAAQQVLPWQTNWYRRIDLLLRLTKAENAVAVDTRF